MKQYKSKIVNQVTKSFFEEKKNFGKSELNMQMTKPIEKTEFYFNTNLFN